jgi:carboxymethylenebutenolidase
LGAYIVRPKVLPAPAVLVLHEVFGVNTDIRKHCDELAEQGFIAVAPDLFWRQEPGVDLSVTSEPDWQRGLRLNQTYDRDAGAKDVKDTANVAANLPGLHRQGCRPRLLPRRADDLPDGRALWRRRRGRLSRW